MITRIHIDKYRSLVDFEYRPGRFEILIGRPGSGRTSILRALEQIDSWLSASEYSRVWDVFPGDSPTAWEKRDVQTFEVEIAGPVDRYVYRVEVAHQSDELGTRLVREELCHGGELLFRYEDGIGQLFDQGRPYTNLCSADGKYSVLEKAMDMTRHDRVRWFLDWWRHFWSVRPEPTDMPEYSNPTREATMPGYSLHGFVPWYRHIERLRPQQIMDLEQELATVIDGFTGLAWVDDEQFRGQRLSAVFRAPRGNATVRYGLESLSQGELALIQLYALAHFALRPGRVMCIDASEACIGMSELRRWIERLRERAEQQSTQVLLTVNEPAVASDMPAHLVRRVDRPDRGATVLC